MARINYLEIYIRRYPDLVLSGSDEYDYDDIQVLNGEKPPKAEMDVYWPEVEAEIEADRAYEQKEDKMNLKYQRRTEMLIEIMRAIVSGDNTTIQKYLDHWDDL